jgi:integrase
MPSGKLRLTQAMVDAVPVPAQADGRLLVYDETTVGLVLIVRPTGKRTWFLRYRPGGRGVKDRWHKLGDGSLPLKAARAAAVTKLGEVQSAKDGKGQAPHEARQQAKRARMKAEAIPTTGDAYTTWLGTLARVKPTVREGYRSLFIQHGQPIAALRVDQVTTREVEALHVGLAAMPVTANRLRARLRTFFTWCEARGYRPRHSNPTDDVKPYPEEEKDRPLTREQLTAVFAAISRAETEGVPVAPERQGRTSGSVAVRPSRAAEMRARREAKGQAPTRARSYTMTQPRAKRGARPDTVAMPLRIARISATAAAALRLLLLTGWREQEVLSLQWVHVNTEIGVADLSDTKTGRSLRPLSDAAVLLLRDLPKLDGCPYVFPSARQRKDGTVGPLTDISSAWYNVRHAAGITARLHDLRHTVASHAVSSGMDLHTVGAMLGHKDYRSTLRYAKHNMASLRAAANQAAAIIESAKPSPKLRVIA